MLAKTITLRNKVFKGTLVEGKLIENPTSKKLDRFSVVLLVEEERNGNKIKVPYQTPLKTISSQAQEAFSIDLLLIQVDEYDIEGKLDTLQKKIVALNTHKGAEIQVEVIDTTYTTFDDEGNEITKSGYEVVYDPDKFTE